MKRIYKYATGDSPPDGSVYLSTVTQTSIEVETPIYDQINPRVRRGIDRSWEPCWLVWHYFLVEESA